jgi:hypothetical protein
MAAEVDVCHDSVQCAFPLDIGDAFESQIAGSDMFGVRLLEMRCLCQGADYASDSIASIEEA